MKKTIWLILAVIVFLSACSSVPKEDQIQTAIVLTEAAKPTSTPLPPTDTPTPMPTSTPTPKPTKTPTPTRTGLTYDEILYKNTYQEFLTEFSTLMTEFLAMNRQAEADPTIIFDTQWKFDLAALFDQLLTITEEMANYPNVPEKFNSFHNWVELLYPETQEFVENYWSSVELIDATYIPKAIENLTNINTYLDNATKELEKLLNP